MGEENPGRLRRVIRRIIDENLHGFEQASLLDQLTFPGRREPEIDSSAVTDNEKCPRCQSIERHLALAET